MTATASPGGQNTGRHDRARHSTAGHSTGAAVVPPAALGLAAGTPLPVGTTVHLDPDTKEIAGGVLFGGSPPRVLRLSGTGARALADLRAGPVASPAAAALARRLTDVGMAHPEPGLPPTGLDQAPAGLDQVPACQDHLAAGPLTPAVTVVIPARDRVARLRRCLAAVAGYPVLVVDDGSADPGALAAVVQAAGAQLVVRAVNGGPGAARNTALQQVSSEFVAFLDSDCEPQPGWVAALAGHFADPLVAAVAPRIVAAPGSPAPESTGAPLDLGDRPARVAPMTRVSYVPTAALLVRRAVLGTGFDEGLRYGEDVDLIWRLIEAGWRVRYEPSVQVAHAGPETLPALLQRRYVYGTSAAALTRRHPGQVAPLVLQPWPTVTMTALLARRPLTAGAAFTVSVVLLARRLQANDLPTTGITRPMAAGVWQTWLGTGRWCGQFAAPAVLTVMARPGGRSARTRWGRRLAAASLLLGPPLVEWAQARDTAALRKAVTDLADQAAYGAGVYAGCLRERTITPLLPSVAWKPFAGLRRPQRARPGR